MCFVKSFGWYESPEYVFIAMEYFPLGDLQPYLLSPLPEKDVQQITYQILEGLLFMHDNGFVHRDLKPNVSFSTCLPLNIAESCRTFLCNPKIRLGG
jgi:serine/threonine protein kinase